MLPVWSDLISYNKRNTHVYFHDVTGEKKAQQAHYYSKYLYTFCKGKHYQFPVNDVYEHHYEYAFKTTAHTLQVWQNGKMIYACTKSWLSAKTLEIRYNRYLYNKYGIGKMIFPAAIAEHRAYTEEQAKRKNILGIASKVLPKELFSEIIGWPTISKSPYSNSFYNSDEIGWNHKPEGSLRISDHWNFYSRGEKHCRTVNEDLCGWAMMKYSNGLYHDPKTQTTASIAA